MLTDQARYSLFRRKLLDRIEGIVRESVKPMEKIEGIRILSVDGLNGGARRWQWRPQRHRRGDRLALRYRVQRADRSPILADIGVEGGALPDAGLIREARDMQGIKESTRKGAPAKLDTPPAAPASGEPALNALRARKA